MRAPPTAQQQRLPQEQPADLAAVGPSALSRPISPVRWRVPISARFIIMMPETSRLDGADAGDRQGEGGQNGGRRWPAWRRA